MERGRIDDQGYACYSSEVIDDSYDQRSAFYDRVRKWTEGNDIILGEGVTKTLPNPWNSELPVTFYLRAPIIEGDYSLTSTVYIKL